VLLWSDSQITSAAALTKRQRLYLLSVVTAVQVLLCQPCISSSPLVRVQYSHKQQQQRATNEQCDPGLFLLTCTEMPLMHTCFGTLRNGFTMHAFLGANLQRSSSSSSSSRGKKKKQQRGVPVHMVGKPNYPEPALLAQYEMLPAGLSHSVRRATTAAPLPLVQLLSTAEAAWEGVVQHMAPPVCSAASGASLSIGMRSCFCNCWACSC
jgi:hypothetical protein